MSDRIELPPCPDCGCAVDDLHVQDELEASLYRFERRLDFTPLRDIELLPCGHKVATYTLQMVKGTHRVVEIHMKTGWKWTLGWSQTDEMVLANAAHRYVEIAKEAQTSMGLTPGQTPGYNAPHADDQAEDPNRTGDGGPPGDPHP